MHLVWQGVAPQGIIVGFAINVNNEFSESDDLYDIATSLKTITGVLVDMRTLYKAILAEIDAWYQCWHAGDFMDIYKAWKELQAYLGSRLQVHQKNGLLIEGLAQQVLPNGDLIMKDPTGKQKTVAFYQVEEIKIIT